MARIDAPDGCKCECHENHCCTCSGCENFHYLQLVKRMQS